MNNREAMMTIKESILTNNVFSNDIKSIRYLAEKHNVDADQVSAMYNLDENLAHLRKDSKPVAKKKVGQKRNAEQEFIDRYLPVFNRLFPAAPAGTGIEMLMAIWEWDVYKQEEYRDVTKRSVLFAQGVNAEDRVLRATLAYIRHRYTIYDRRIEDYKTERQDYLDTSWDIAKEWGYVNPTHKVIGDNNYEAERS